ncbi:hypothetical protein BC831DRAFT_397405 [Entophlyctis helioformis]|nr:hypothetical protein BC831DRAFT_397405 [Entophlyctis helioformis]
MFDCGIPSSQNTVLGTQEDRMMITGLHTVADLHCSGCQAIIGWKYAKYKVGTFIIEKAKMAKSNGWMLPNATEE